REGPAPPRGGPDMPEGHSVHRITRQFARNFVGAAVSASSPQGRFAEGAAVLDGREMLSAKAVGKQMFLEFEDETWLRVHLGLYGAWDFAGEILVDPTIASANGRMGQTNQRGTDLDEEVVDEAISVAPGGTPCPRSVRPAVRGCTCGCRSRPRGWRTRARTGRRPWSGRCAFAC